MSILEILASLLGLSALFGWINYQYFRLPHTIGLIVIALLASGGIVLVDALVPSLGIGETVRGELKSIDFYKALMEGFLSALLFAGAVHIDLSIVAQRKWAIALMASIGILISTFLIGATFWAVAGLLGIEIPFLWALVFGALISPTDPVAVLAILKTVKVPPLLQAKIAGESLFNDGVGVVVFTIILALAAGSAHGGGAEMGVAQAIGLFLSEAVGGAVLGLVFGMVAFALMKSVNEHNLEVLITLALVTVTYAVALKLHLSGPIAVVVAGILIGNQGARLAMSDSTREHVFQFWELTDEILNSVLFLLIGLEVLVIGFTYQNVALGLLAIPISLSARFIAVATPIKLLSVRQSFTNGTIRILTWGGLRGGISVALALSLPESPYKGPILAATYAVVVFSIIFQGLTMEGLVKRLVSPQSSDPGEPKGKTA